MWTVKSDNSALALKDILIMTIVINVCGEWDEYLNCLNLIMYV